MLDDFVALHPVVQALAAGLFTWLVTAAGAALVFVRRELPAAWLDAMLGFASGVMLAASFWSLLEPAIAMATAQGLPGWLPAAVGFVGGAATLRLCDRFLPHLHPLLPRERAEGLPTHWRETTLLILAITLHNIPEGLAIGVAFGAAANGETAAAGATFAAAVALAVGIGLQNFPEGAAVALPLRANGVAPRRCFWAGTLSAAVEPAAAALGAAAVLAIRALLPFALAFAAGAMVYVVVEELIPEAQQRGRGDLATLAAVAGFTVMMILDVALG